MGSEQSKPNKEKDGPREPNLVAARPSPLTKPVDVPAAKEAYIVSPSPIDPDATVADERYQLPPAQFIRPPRLPLPIEKELHTPGSPILTPADLQVPVDVLEVEGVLPRRASMLSSTTVDEEEEVDDFATGPEGGVLATVPKLIEWTEGGEKVYVTGTFAGWDRKYRLHKE
jgi:hypothetical protein